MQHKGSGTKPYERTVSTGRRVSATAALVLACVSILWTAATAGPEESPGLRKLDSLAWMAGCWGSTAGSASADECWLARRGNVMIGFHVDVSENGRTFYEYLRIVSAGDDVDYYASPMGGPSTAFRLVRTDGQRAVFENPQHDWPQRITYWREGDRLHARAEGLDDTSRKADWVWERRPGS